MLKSLHLDGFKSFADRTRIDLRSGVTAIVGPNGSGKSNLVDAVKWVLGSQSARSLRGKEMTDVIFNGAESRGPMGGAEVSLVFDNPEVAEGRRRFPMDHAEVRLTRRVGRDGEGQYLVNGRMCRLRDFRELLAGTGVGPDSYSIIEQGRVDAALRASPAERRLLLEEAAGISRFRLKKREAARRLDRVEQNLLRLSDIVDEVEGRLRRVRAQATKARRYRDATLRLKDACTALASHDYRRLEGERQRLDADHRRCTERLDALRESAAEHEQQLAALHEGSSADEAAERALRTAEQRRARAAQATAIALANAARNTKDESTARTRLREARSVALENPAESEAQRAVEAAEQSAVEYREKVREAEAQANKATEACDQATQLRDTQARHSARVESLRNRVQNAVEACGRRIETLEQSLVDRAAEVATAHRDAQTTGEQLASAIQRRDESADALLQHDQAIGRLQRDLSTARSVLGEGRDRSASLRERLAGMRHRLESLETERRRLDQLNADAQRLVDAAPTRGATGLQLHGLVADLLHVEEDFVPLVEACLESRVEHVVVGSREALLRTLEPRRGESLSPSVRCGFQSLDTGPPPAAVDQIDLRGEPGVLGAAIDFVEVEPRFAPLVRSLFARTWFVERLATARRLGESVGKGLTFVTLECEVVRSDGAVVLGPLDGGLHPLARGGDLQRVREQIAKVETDLQQATQLTEATQTKIDELETAVAARQAAASEQRGRLASIAQQAAALEERRRQFDSVHQRAASLAQADEAELHAAQQRAAILDRRASQLAEAAPDHTSSVAERLDHAQREKAAWHARLGELRAAAGRHEELLKSLQAEARASAVRDDHARIVAAVRDASAALTHATHESATLVAAALNESATLHACALTCETALAATRANRAARRSAEQARIELAATAAQARADADALQQRSADSAMQRQRVELEAKAIAQRVRDEYGVDVATLATSPDSDPDDPRRLREEVEKLREEIKQVGAVNHSALAELDEIEQRFTDLSQQFEDLSQAKKSLTRLTSRIDGESRELFQATFQNVREHFRELFSRLFGGGEADLLLVDPPEGADPLEGGVEIVASPPGKELRSLSLLSGGEKTLTCVALLLALFRSRPSPFCLLDEVDAALDEANVGRFIDVLKDFLGATQFLVVTHSRRTMAAADTLYGVTMQESGVSKHLSLRLEDVGARGVIRSASRKAA